MVNLNRREFIQLSVISGSCLSLGLPVFAENTKGKQLHPLIQVDENGKVIVFAQNPEMGQGVKTSLPMIIAEELNVDWNEIIVKQADWIKDIDNQFSGGSLSIRLNYDAMRKAGASVREMMTQAAANQWGVAKEELISEDGKIHHKGSNRSLSYGDLTRRAALLPVPEEPELKPGSEFKIIGKDTSDVDLDNIINGSQEYSIDLKLPGMLYAVVKRSPYSDGQPLSFDKTGASKVPGVRQFIKLRNDEYGGRIILPNNPNFVSGVAIIAENTWAAMEGARLLKVKWEKPEKPDDTDSLEKEFAKKITDKGEQVRVDGDFNRAFNTSATSLDVKYKLPFLSHVPMEPMNCTADVRDDSITIWAPTQSPKYTAEAVAKALGKPADKITVKVLRSGGGFGRRFYGDFAIDAAILSAKLKKPVKVVWTREEDIQHDYYRPASLHRVKAAVDENGRISAWHHKVASHPRKTFLERDGSPAEIDNYEFPAAFIPNLLYEYVHVPARIPLGQWRAVEHSSNVFVVGSVIDELAHKAGIDTVTFLLDLIGKEQFVQVIEIFKFDASRLANVVRQAAAMSGWDKPLPAGQGRGIAASYNQGAWVAEVAEVTVKKDSLKVDKIYAAIDCGLVINPSTAQNQVEGGIIEGLSAALNGEITVKDGIVQQSNFHDYPITRMSQAPEIKISFIKSEDKPRGLGEPPLPPVAAAIGNAIFAASGQRIRELPLKKFFPV